MTIVGYNPLENAVLIDKDYTVSPQEFKLKTAITKLAESMTPLERRRAGIVKCYYCKQFTNRSMYSVMRFYSCEPCKRRRAQKNTIEKYVKKHGVNWKNPDQRRAYVRLQYRRLREKWGAFSKPKGL